MDKKKIAVEYLRCLQEADGAGAARLFTENGVIDDFGGGHSEGRDEIEAFIDRRPAGTTVDAPLRTTESASPSRLTVYGQVNIPNYASIPRVPAGVGDDVKVRWVFHFEGDEIAHLNNSWVRYLVGIDDPRNP